MAAQEPMTSGDDGGEVRLVLCTCPPEAAPSLAEALVASRHAACVNVLPEIVSSYRWEGAVQRDAESLLLIKTTAPRLAALGAKIREIHPYELPEVIAVPVTGGLAAYLAWVETESRAPA